MSSDGKVPSANWLFMALCIFYRQLPNILRPHYSAGKQRIVFGSLEHYGTALNTTAALSAGTNVHLWECHGTGWAFFSSHCWYIWGKLTSSYLVWFFLCFDGQLLNKAVASGFSPRKKLFIGSTQGMRSLHDLVLKHFIGALTEIFSRCQNTDFIFVVQSPYIPVLLPDGIRRALLSLYFSRPQIVRNSKLTSVLPGLFI